MSGGGARRLSRRDFFWLVGAGAVGVAAGAAAGCSDGGDEAGSGTTVSGGGTASGQVVVTAPEPPPLDLPGDPFTLGVASGDPTPTSVILWTRLAPDPSAGGGMPGGAAVLVWEVAADDQFADLVAADLVTADPASAHAVHVDVDGLEPDRWYHYRFRAGSFTSPAGRTRTAPASGAPTDRLRLVAVSCQNYEHGYYTAYPHVVGEEPDLVLFLGDYIYESTADDPVRSHGAPEPRDLAGYRDRYAVYRSDADLQAAHAACPWVVIWDDHEVVDDYAGGEANSALSRRRAAAYRAWWEHQPVRLPPPAGDELTIHRSLAWGDLASMIMLDGRQYRSPQACGGGFAAPCAEADDPARTLLGPEQEQWLAEELGAAAGTWTVLAQQVVLGDLSVLNTINTDQWDGYTAARRRVLESLKSSGAANPIVLTGDIHAALVTDVELDDEAVATEFVGPSISSRFPDALVQLFESIPTFKPTVTYANATRHGYVVCTVTPSEWRTDYRGVDTTDRPTAALTTDASFVVRPGVVGAERAP